MVACCPLKIFVFLSNLGMNETEFEWSCQYLALILTLPHSIKIFLTRWLFLLRCEQIIYSFDASMMFEEGHSNYDYHFSKK